MNHKTIQRSQNDQRSETLGDRAERIYREIQLKKVKKLKDKLIKKKLSRINKECV